MKRIEKTPLGCCRRILPNSAGILADFKNSAILLALPRQTRLFRACLWSAPLNLNGLRIGSKGRTRRVLSPISGQDIAVFPRKCKLIFQNPAQLKNNSFATFTTQFTTHPFLSKNVTKNAVKNNYGNCQ
jgi:hypothetical protein